MIKLIHTSDLHLAESDVDYSFRILGDIVNLAIHEQADAILFCGDVFNDFQSLKKLKDRFEKSFAAFDGRVIYTTGNHEYLKTGKEDFNLLAFGSKIEFYFAEDLAQIKPVIISRDNLVTEIIPVPFQRKNDGYEKLHLPEKQGYRIAMLHGSVPEILSYTGISDEDEDSLIDFNAIKRNRIDMMALGHIHKKTVREYAGISCCYPGSPRVWRSGEDGLKTVNLISVSGQKTSVTEHTLPSSGQYYKIKLQLNYAAPDMTALEGYTSDDWLDVELNGYIESEQQLSAMIGEIRQKTENKVRVFEISKDQVFILPELMENKTVKAFMAEWNLRKPADPEKTGVWLKARDIFIESIKDKI